MSDVSREEFSKVQDTVQRFMGWWQSVLFILTVGVLTYFADILPLRRGPQGAPGAGAPIGAVIAWPGSALPSGESGVWKPCRGQLVEYSNELWEALQGSYGNENKGEDIKLPDFRGMFLRGAKGSGRHASAKPGAKQSDQIGDHAHKAGTLFAQIAFSENVMGFSVVDGKQFKISRSASKLQDVKGDNSSYSDGTKVAGSTDRQGSSSTETRPANFAVHWIIRVK